MGIIRRTPPIERCVEQGTIEIVMGDGRPGCARAGVGEEVFDQSHDQGNRAPKCSYGPTVSRHACLVRPVDGHIAPAFISLHANAGVTLWLECVTPGPQRTGRSRVATVVDILQQVEGVFVIAEPDMQAMFEVASILVAPAGRLPANPPAHLVDGHLVLVAQLLRP